MHVIDAKAVAFGEALGDGYKADMVQVVKNARAMTSALSAGGLRIVSGGTDCHMFRLDVRPQGITGKVAEEALEEAGITVNKNTIPFDPESPFVTSGIRIGTAAITSRGLGEVESRAVADLILRVLAAPDDKSVKQAIHREVGELTARFPIYRDC